MLFNLFMIIKSKTTFFSCVKVNEQYILNIFNLCYEYLKSQNCFIVTIPGLVQNYWLRYYYLNLKIK